jgi:hypothetical protein
MKSPGLDQIVVRLSDTREIVLLDLLQAWGQHVDRIRDEENLHAGHGWTAHDLVASLVLRERIAASVGEQPTEIQSAAAEYLSGPDDLFSAISVEDRRGTVRRFADDVGSTSGWWWSRLPRSGPIRIELDDWQRRHNDG